MDSVCDMKVVIARLEKRPAEVETPVETPQPKRLPPLPLSRAELSHVPTKNASRSIVFETSMP